MVTPVLPDTAEAGPAPQQPGALSGTELPSFQAARALLCGRHSCLVLDTHRRHIALPPRYLRRKRTGIRGQLNTELLRYSEGLNGVPVAYNDIKIIGELGDIYDDQGHIHINIEAEFVVFRPKTGDKLVGVVNKVAPSHIGCLVHGCFNASVPKPPKMSAEDWQNFGVKIGDQLEFEVFRLDSDAVGVFCIRGKLDVESIQVTSSDTPPDEPADTNGGVDCVASPLTEKRKKKKTILNGENVDSGTEDIGNISGVPLLGYTDRAMETVLLEEKAKKKRKKHKQQESVIQEVDFDYVVDNKKEKKRKLPEDDQSEQSEEPKAKKKRRA